MKRLNSNYIYCKLTEYCCSKNTSHMKQHQIISTVYYFFLLGTLLVVLVKSGC